jgi:lipopolysaccharide/colanic/teichoic acid biosynthesis glycosyltransferase
LPPVVWFLGDPFYLAQSTSINTGLASAVATTATWYSLEQLRYFAKARRLSYVLPANVASFALCYAVIAGFRLPYSNVVAVLNFLSVSGLSYVITSLTRRQGQRNWLVPGGQVDEIDADNATFAVLDLATLKRLIEAPGRGQSIIADLHHPLDPEWEMWLAEAAINGIPVYHYRQILEMQSGQVRIDHLRENDLGSLIPNLAYTGLKRLIDIVVSIAALPILLLFCLVIAALIKLDSRGPVFFHQERVGHRGRTFRMHKFRSMQVRERPLGDEAEREDAITKDQDARITRFGVFIRRYRIDELPQVANILKGEMSWIGPRPEAQSLSFLYQQQIPFYRYRHIVRPGITGWAQVNQGHVAAVNEVSAKLGYDFYYVRNISLWLDLLIVLKTIRIVIGGFGAK